MFGLQCPPRSVEEREEEEIDGCKRGGTYQRTGSISSFCICPFNLSGFPLFAFSYSLLQIGQIQAMLEARMGVEELPSWVFFPDKERAEWVNTMLKQVLSKEKKNQN